MPRILHVAQTTAGGIASYFEEIGPFQSARYGAGNVHFVVPSGSAHLPSVDPAMLIHFPSASRDPRSLLDFTRTALRAIDETRPDIVHLHSTFAGAILRPLLRRRRRRPLIAYCPHGWAFGMETSSAKQRAYALVERRLASMTDLIHVVSRSEYALAESFGIPPDRMRVLPNGIAWTPPPPTLAKTGPLRIAFIGRHDRQKGLDLLLDAIRSGGLSHIQFDIVGSRVVSDEARIEEAAPDNVTFHGWLARSDAMRVLCNADAMVMPSRWDAAPIVAIEAMRAGVPVIGSNRGAIPEIVNDGVGGYIFDLDDPGALKRCLERLTRDDLEKLGGTARARWQQYYDSSRMNAMTCQAYDEILGRAATAPSNDAAKAASGSPLDGLAAK
jgi:glycosyltransferase involved in cell wall biosynthesis